MIKWVYMANWTGKEIGKYEIKELLGRGGMGEVYRAFQPTLERDVAIKTIHTHPTSDSSMADRFRREAKVVAALRHPGIIQVYDFDVDDETFYMVMEFVAGETLQQRLVTLHTKGERLPLSKALALFHAITLAVAYAHSQEVVHRDLKPANVLLTTEEQPVLADFGLSKIISGERLTAPGDVMGTPQYMAPEQISGEETDAAVDVYALGVMLYEMTTGTLPFQGDTPAGVLLKHLTEPPAPPRSINPDLPEAVDQLIQKMLVKEPARRYASAQELLAALEGVMAERGVLEILEVGTITTGITPPPLDDGRCPYRGLQSFEAEHAEFYFGREVLIEQLVGQVANMSKSVRGAAIGRFLAVLGASGSGKSSLVRAGLVPALQDGTVPGSDRWASLVIKPGGHPLEELAARLAPVLNRHEDRLAATRQLLDNLTDDGRALHLAVRLAWSEAPAEQRLLLVVDQFEEIFTLCHDEAERQRFIENLLFAANIEGRVFVVLTMRADFYHRCAVYRDLASQISAQQLLVGPMSEAELRRAIERPARQVGLRFEPGLVDTILADVAEQPGALPLLQHALLELWEQRQRGLLTLEAYRASGGVAGAIAQRAETLYHDFSPDEQAIVRRVMLRLTQPGEGTEDTRRRVQLKELVPGMANERMANGESPNLQSPISSVIQRLADARLVTTTRDVASGEEMVDVAHEALIRGWERLRGWLDEDRAALRTHRRLTEAAEEWARNNRDSSYLYHGARLAEAEEWTETHIDEMNELEQTFLTASITERERVVQEQETQRQRELVVAQKLAEEAEARRQAEAQRAEIQAKTAQRFRRLAAGLAIIFVLAVIAAGFAWQQRQEAVRQSRLSLAQSLASQALRTVDRENDTELATLLAIEAFNLNRSAENAELELTDNALLREILSEPYFNSVLKHEERIFAVAFSPDGKTLATGGESGVVRLWDVSTSLNTSLADSTAEPVLLSGHEGRIFSVAFSPNGNTIATGSDDKTVRLWNFANPNEEPVVLRGHEDQVWSVAFSPDGKRLASGSADQTVRVWNVSALLNTSLADLNEAPVVLSGHQDRVWSVAFSPDSQILASTSDDQTVRLWNPAEPNHEPVVLNHEARVYSVAFSADGQTIATGSADGTVRLWDVSTSLNTGVTEPDAEPVVLHEHEDAVWSVAFSPDNQMLATTSADNTVRLWQFASSPAGSLTDSTIESVVLPGHESSVWSAAFSQDGRRLATGSNDRTVRLWNLAEPSAAPLVLKGYGDQVDAIAFNPNTQESTGGQALATLGADNQVRLGSLAFGAEGDPADPSVAPLVLSAPADYVISVAFSPDGQMLALGGYNPTIWLWDLRAPGNAPLAVTNPGVTGGSLAFNPNGQTVAVGGNAPSVWLWNLSDLKAEPVVLRGREGQVAQIAFSPDGQTLAVGTADRLIRLWDLAAPKGEPVILRGHGGGRVWSVAFSPDGQTLASASNDQTVRLWDMANLGREPLVLNHQAVVRTVTFSPNGRILATGSADGAARLWLLDSSSGEGIAQPRGEPIVLNHEAVVIRAIFTPDGQKLATLTADGKAWLWIATTEALAELGCQQVRRNLTQAEWEQYLPNEAYRQTCPHLPPGQ